MIAETTARPSAPAANKGALFSGVRPPIAMTGLRVSARAPEALNAQRRRRIRFRLLRIDRAEPEIIGRRRIGPQNLRRIRDGEADDPVGAEQPARVLHRQIALPDMDAIGVDRQRDIKSIIDDEQDAKRRQRSLERARFLQKGPRRRRLLAQLHHGCAAAYGGGDDIQERPAARETAIGDEAQAQGGRVNRHSDDLQAAGDILGTDRIEHVDKSHAEGARTIREFAGHFARDAVDGDRGGRRDETIF